MCLISKKMTHKPYNDFQSLPVSTYWWKNLLINFITRLPISTNWKRESYNSILVIVDWLTKIVYYKLVKIIINTPRLIKIIKDMLVWYHGLPDLIITSKGSLFTLKFWLFFCYFFWNKRQVICRILFSISRPNKAGKEYHRGVSLSFCQF